MTVILILTWALYDHWSSHFYRFPFWSIHKNENLNTRSLQSGFFHLTYCYLVCSFPAWPKHIHRAHCCSQILYLLTSVLEKAEELEIKLPTSAGSSKKQESSRKTSISALLTMPKPLTMWITINCGKFWRRGEYHTTWPASWEICRSGSNS